jgi:hypothetical protein
MEGTAVTELEFRGSTFYLMDESLCSAIQNGLGMNETLAKLEVREVPICADNIALWSRAFSFLRSHKALRSLIINLKYVMKQPCTSACRIGVATMLQHNTSLESLFILSWNDVAINTEEYIVLVTILQHNKSFSEKDPVLKDFG